MKEPKAPLALRAARAAAALAVAALAAAPLPAAAGESCRIAYLGGAEAMVAPDRDIFEQFGALMPGDEACGAVEVSNAGAVPVKMWFWAEGASEPDPLLSEALLEIVNMSTGECVYAGTLHPDGIETPIFLGEYAPGEGADLSWAITLPAYLGNEHMGRAASVTWTFAAQEAAGAGGGYFAKTGVDLTAPAALGAGLLACSCVAAVAARRAGRSE